jgi:hypothetical protein
LQANEPSPCFGVLGIGAFVSTILEYAENLNISLTAHVSKIAWTSLNSFKEFIKEGLLDNSPVALFETFNIVKMISFVSNDPNASPNQTFTRHWVTITGMSEDESSNDTILTVSTWGGIGKISLNSYYKAQMTIDVLVSPGAVYFT